MTRGGGYGGGSGGAPNAPAEAGGKGGRGSDCARAIAGVTTSDSAAATTLFLIEITRHPGK
jgi:hypothetical protein